MREKSPMDKINRMIRSHTSAGFSFGKTMGRSKMRLKKFDSFMSLKSHSNIFDVLLECHLNVALC